MGRTNDAPPGQHAWHYVGFLAVWLFGLVEFVNYFVVRLSYPLPVWVRRVRRWQHPQLIHDIRAALT